MTDGTPKRAHVRVGVIGVGGIGRTHLNAYRDAGNPAVALTDIDPLRAAAAEAEFGVTAYSDAASMLRLAELEGVSICTPPAQHLSVALAAIDAGVSVLCEKPMATSVADCEKMRDAGANAGVLVWVGFCHRFQPQVQAMRVAASRGLIGSVLAFHSRFSGPLAGVEDSWFARREVSGGGVLMDTCVHSVDLFRYLVGEVADVRALMSTTETDRGPALDVEDTVALILRSTHGVLGSIEASWRTAPGQAVLALHGTQGSLTLDYSTLRLIHTPSDDASPVTIEVADGDRFVSQAAHFLACVRGSEEPLITASDGVAAIDVLTKAYESAR